MRKIFPVLVLMIVMGPPGFSSGAELHLDRIKLALGFSISLFPPMCPLQGKWFSALAGHYLQAQ